MLVDLTGKVALVTGSTRGIGHAAAIRLAEAGAHVLVNGRNEGEPLDEAVQAVTKRAKARVIAEAADVTSQAGAMALAGVPKLRLNGGSISLNFLSAAGT